jgi:hypothetical protein
LGWFLRMFFGSFWTCLDNDFVVEDEDFL